MKGGGISKFSILKYLTHTQKMNYKFALTAPLKVGLAKYLINKFYRPLPIYNSTVAMKAYMGLYKNRFKNRRLASRNFNQKKNLNLNHDYFYIQIHSTVQFIRCQQNI